MGYQALLFCPDEKTARTVTQVLSELEFNVESCTEPFAAVKKLMGQHFDAVVVDCDNEQNATLLFKSARNSTSNQASLAVAVVEGQAGVAKAFRIGANLVLTKPINIEQAKGTLRVARGLLRKSDPGKPGATTTAAFPAIPAGNFNTLTPSGSAISPATSQAMPAPAAITASKVAARDHDRDSYETAEENSAAASSEAPVKPAAKFITPAPQADKFLAAAVVSAPPEAKTPPASASPATFGRGAASAPAPARVREDAHVAQKLTELPSATEARSKAKEAVQNEPSPLVGSAPSFTFGGANAPAESSGGGKKLLAVAAIVIVAAAAYAGWTHFHGRTGQPETTQLETTPSPVAPQQSVKPSGVKPSPASEPRLSQSVPSSQPAAPKPTNHTSDLDSSSDDADTSSAPNSTKASSSPSSTATKTAVAAEEPLVVKGGKAPAVHAKSVVTDAPAPSMIGIATAGAGAPPPNFVGDGAIVPKPLLQTMNISQGVSRGLLIKKVQPSYPRNALSMGMEGSVELLATISKTGDITHVKVLSGDPQLARAATEAVKQWKYKPYLLNGEPVEIQTQVTINFKLPR